MRRVLAVAGALLFGIMGAQAVPLAITIDDRNVYPESLDSAPDGTLYIGCTKACAESWWNNRITLCGSAITTAGNPR